MIFEPDVASNAPLRGIRVLELGQMIAGPFCGHLFADYGAEVIKLESPGQGDVMRQWGGLYKGLGLYWPVIARNKKSVTLDLRRPEGQDLAKALLPSADVLVENFRPGTLERWKLDWDTIHRLNPRLILVRVSGYGQTGPYREKAGFGSIGEAMSGFRYLSGEPGRAPVRVGISIGDSLAGTFGFIGALLALYRRDGPQGLGCGQQVDVGIYEAMWAYMESLLPEYDKLGTIRQPTGSSLPGIAPSNVYPTADGQWILIGANLDSVFKRLAQLLGHPEWAEEGTVYSTFSGRGAHQAELDAQIATWTGKEMANALLTTLDAAGVPAGRIYTVADIVRDSQYAARQMVISVPDPNLDGEAVRMQGIVPKLSETPGRVERGGPLLGEHNNEIWGDLVGPERLALLRQSGIV